MEALQNIGQRRIQQRAARQLCKSFGHSYMHTGQHLVVCVYCAHSTALSLATESLMAEAESVSEL